MNGSHRWKYWWLSWVWCKGGIYLIEWIHLRGRKEFQLRNKWEIELIFKYQQWWDIFFFDTAFDWSLKK